jgi:hypothetical protein
MCPTEEEQGNWNHFSLDEAMHNMKKTVKWQVLEVKMALCLARSNERESDYTDPEKMKK